MRVNAHLMNPCRQTTTRFDRCARSAVAALCVLAGAPSALAFSEGKSTNNATLEFAVVVPRFVGLRVESDGRLAVTSNSGEVLVTAVQKAVQRRRRFAEASDPPDYSSEIDIQTFDVDPEFRSNPTLVAGRQALLPGEARAQLVTLRSRSGRTSTAVNGIAAGSTTVTAP
jgi:hypothetical protein